MDSCPLPGQLPGLHTAVTPSTPCHAASLAMQAYPCPPAQPAARAGQHQQRGSWYQLYLRRRCPCRRRRQCQSCTLQPTFSSNRAVARRPLCAVAAPPPAAAAVAGMAMSCSPGTSSMAMRCSGRCASACAGRGLARGMHVWCMLACVARNARWACVVHAGMHGWRRLCINPLGAASFYPLAPTLTALTSLPSSHSRVQGWAISWMEWGKLYPSAAERQSLPPIRLG